MGASGPRRAVLSREVRPGAPESQGERGKFPLTPEADGGGSPPFEDFKGSEPQAEPPAAGGGAREASASSPPPQPLGPAARGAAGSEPAEPSLPPAKFWPQPAPRPPPPPRSSRRWPGRGAAPRPGPARPPSPRPPDVTSWKPSGPLASLTMAPPFRPEI